MKHDADMVVFSQYDYALAYTLLEEYVRSFDRDIPFRIKQLVNIAGQSFSLTYANLQCEQDLKHIKGMLVERRALPDIIPRFRSVVDELDAQYLAIRAARRALFDHDITDSGCDIDCEIWRCDEKIDWLVLEPLVGASIEASQINRSPRLKSRSWGDLGLIPRLNESEPWKWGNGDTYTSVNTWANSGGWGNDGGW